MAMKDHVKMYFDISKIFERSAEPNAHIPNILHIGSNDLVLESHALEMPNILISNLYKVAISLF